MKTKIVIIVVLVLVAGYLLYRQISKKQQDDILHKHLPDNIIESLLPVERAALTAFYTAADAGKKVIPGSKLDNQIKAANNKYNIDVMSSAALATAFI